MKDEGIIMNQYGPTIALIVVLVGLTICNMAYAEPAVEKPTLVNQSAGNIDVKLPDENAPTTEQTQDNDKIDELDLDSSGSLIRVGMYDSRALAVAHGQSDEYQNRMSQLRVDAKKARTEGNEKTARQFDIQLAAMMGPIREQAHSTRPIGDILETVKGMIPGIAEEANVDIIVSKWAIAYERPGIQYVDVTDLMVKTFFDPKASTLTSIKNILKNDPAPLHKYK